MIETVPNVSEGQRPEVVSAMSAALHLVPGLRLLDVSSDPSHNRSVFTMAAGEERTLESAILALADVAISRIDLRAHHGVHPRLGAVDVVPFIPLTGATMLECVQLARRVGAALAHGYGVPVFLYEEAARDPGRRALEGIRRGGLQALAARMAAGEAEPDFGPRVPHPTAGVTVVGARRALIAFNVNLTSDRLDIARQIAAAIRTSGGGLPELKALGLRLAHRGIAQVSMNLTNYEKTSLAAAFEAVRGEAERRGVAILESELVGLVPAAALAGIEPSAIGLKDFRADRILERSLEATRA